MIRTFIDSGVLIAAARGDGIMAQTSLDILQDTNREFVSSIFLKMEVLPKAIYNKKIDEVMIDSYSPILKSNVGGKNFGIKYLHRQLSLSFCPTLVVI